jgi:hypothetical protein
MGDAVKSLTDNLELIADCCRYSEGILTEKQVRQKYHLVDDATWERLGSDDALVEAIELEKTRRVRSGQAKRERAQAHVVEACGVLGEIMRDAGASPKHRIDASKALDAFADNGPQAPPAADRFVIRIDLTAGGNKDDVITIDKSTKPSRPGDGEILEPGNDTGARPQRLLEAKKDGEPW